MGDVGGRRPRRSPVPKKSASRRRAAPRRKATGSRRRTTSFRSYFSRNRRRIFWWSGAGALLLLVGYGIYLDREITSRFEGSRWEIPAHVYARPLELYAGLALSADRLQQELTTLGYRAVKSAGRPGSYHRQGDRFQLRTRGFRFWDGDQPSADLDLRFSGDTLTTLRENGKDVVLTRLDPYLLGSIRLGAHEDRVLLRLEEVPRPLVTALFAIEDRNFYSHPGIDPRGIVRALWANLRAGATVQGGSTLTQQLVKNYFLSADRTLRRKLVEVVMSLLLEWHYGKAEILEAYLNEVYLGQQGNRAIHGFGLASRFYFHRPLAELELPELALLAGLVKGPSQFNPRRHPKRALERRNLVLSEMARLGYLSPADAARASEAPLGLASISTNDTFSAHSAYMTLAREQLLADYPAESLRQEGLRVFTAYDPIVQRAAEDAVAGQLAQLEKRRKMKPGTLQAAAVVLDRGTGEVRALVGGRDGRPGTFNRAIDSRRPVGSLIKPFVYLTALSDPDHYTLATLLEDTAIRVRQAGAPVWEPHNFDRKFHGAVPLAEALAQSYNAATAHLGMAVGVNAVLDQLMALGLAQRPPAYPATLLGSLDASPLEMARLYHGIASGGARMPVKAVRSVLTAEEQPLSRYPLDVETAASAGAVFLVTTALQHTVRAGTGRRLADFLPKSLAVAGKTGTTNDFRDSWFAGFTGDLLAVVWVGRDDNQSTGLTGASGAMRVFGDLMARLPVEPLKPRVPEGTRWAFVDRVSGRRSGSQCSNVVQLPFLAGSRLPPAGGCSNEGSDEAADPADPAAQQKPGKLKRWMKKIFGR
ncbi:MAG: penicillin-binding protein 1B [Gammaproteobacteria bacterium]|nr:penicillin-binding protein 1B [Gammaproteobacteria bacterium]